MRSQKSQFLQYYSVIQAKSSHRETILGSLPLTLFSIQSQGTAAEKASWVESRGTQASFFHIENHLSSCSEQKGHREVNHICIIKFLK